MSYRVAVVGATGNVGREILSTLAEREFPIEKIYALASRSSVGKEISFGEDEVLKVDSLEGFDFSKVDLVLSSTSSDVVDSFAKQATEAGAVVIDNSSAFRTDADVPLIVPEVNPDAFEFARHKNIIANPNCVAIPLSMALKPLQGLAPLKRVVVSTYQSTSGAGYQAMDELFRQTRAVFVNDPIEKENFTKQIAFNVIPQIGDFEDNGYTGEENKIMFETQKILGSPFAITATAVRVPSFVGHAIAVSAEFESAVDLKEARQALKDFEGVSVVDHRHEEGFVTPVESAGEDSVFVSRLREDPSVSYGLTFWVVSDNLRKGAALNTVQIAEQFIKYGR